MYLGEYFFTERVILEQAAHRSGVPVSIKKKSVNVAFRAWFSGGLDSATLTVEA